MSVLKVKRSSYVVLDIETTGLSPANDSIIEIAAMLVKDGVPSHIFSTLVGPPRYISPKVIEITGITPDMLKGKPTINEVLDRFTKFAGNHVIIGHNIRFDVSFIKEAYRKHIGIEYDPETLCTLKLSKRLLPNLDAHKMFMLLDYFGIEYDANSLHRAKNDVIANYKLFLNLVSIIEKQYQHEKQLNFTNNKTANKTNLFNFNQQEQE